MRGLEKGTDRQTNRYIDKLTSQIYETIGLRAGALKSTSPKIFIVLFSY